MPLELSATGEVVALAPDEMRGLLDAPIPSFADHDLVTSRVEAAIALYRSRNSTRIDRRHAVRELADVLEALRSEIKGEMLPKDERELFNLANGFAIRHNTRDQRKDYDDAIWLSWAGPFTSISRPSTQCCGSRSASRRQRPCSRRSALRLLGLAPE